jgi:adenine modification enzyme
MEHRTDGLVSTGRRDYLRDENGTAVGFGDERYQVRVIPRAQAVATIIAHHYSGRIVNNSYVHLGVFLDGAYVGALQFGYALNPNSGGRVVPGTPNRGYLELNRMWIADSVPRNGETMALAFAVRYIRTAYPGVAWIQSFADERCGRWGAVYQAASFLYCGFHWTDFWRLDGVWYHDMLLTAHKKGGQRGAYLRANLARAERHRFRQFRYFRPFHPAARRGLRLSVLPYPKPGGLHDR